MASALHWVPESLYNLSISTIVSNRICLGKNIKDLPSNVLFDVYHQLYKHGKLNLLNMALSELKVFEKVLKTNDKRHLLHHSFQALMDEGYQIAQNLSDKYIQLCCMQHCTSPEEKINTINLGLSLGLFLSDAGWFEGSEMVYVSCLRLCNNVPDDPRFIYRYIECCSRLIYVRKNHCNFRQIEVIIGKTYLYAKKLIAMNLEPNLVEFHTQCSSFYFSQSLFDKAYQSSMKSLKELKNSTPVRIAIDVLRQASKVCIVKRLFRQSEILIKHAVKLATEKLGSNHPKTSAVLSDYGFFLLNVDNVKHAVVIYQTALNIRQSLFGGNNLLLAQSHEDLAYACYVENYSIGVFTDAREHIDKALKIMKCLLPYNHLLFASTKRVKALVLEEIALETYDTEDRKRFLDHAQDLHLSAFQLTLKAFGETNVLTAKHYGNLGRLYQSMQLYDKAKQMHLKAISIKEKILGQEDYEVSLSLGHLASLYTYDLGEYVSAKSLYLKAIEIGKKLFGNGYSGLEYDYRGLIRVYSELKELDQVVHYQMMFEEWKTLRHLMANSNKSPLDSVSSDSKTEDIIEHFFKMGSKHYDVSPGLLVSNH